MGTVEFFPLSVTLDQTESPDIGHAHLRVDFFSLKIAKCEKPTFSNFYYSFCMSCFKICPYSLLTELNQSYQRNFATF